MVNFRKVFILILLLLGSLYIGCRSSIIEKENLNVKDIFSKEGTYLVVFYDGKEIPSIDEYCQSRKKGKVEYPVYMVDVTKEEGFIRKYEGLDGQGSNSDFYVDGVNKVEDLCISSIPSVIKISDSASFVTNGLEKVNAYFKGLIQSYRISFELDGGKFSSDIENKFNEPKKYVLPIPEKEGYIFLGYKENENYIEEIESRDYNLKAVWTERFEYDVIKDNEVLSQNEDKYLVYVMKDNCSYCDKTKDSVLRYIYLQRNLNPDAPKLYVVNITDSNILRKSTPTLMEVTTVKDKKISEDICVGATKVKNKLNEILNSKDDSYTINVNYGDESVDYTFKGWQDPVLPEYEKEGYLLIGYEENGIYLENISRKSANLDAVFIKSEYETINDNEIFSKEEQHYLVYFMKNGCSYCEKIKADVLKYLYLTSKEEYSKSLKLYVVNLNTGDYKSSILRKYSDELETLVNGVTKWDDLYISSTPTLIEIKKGVSNLIEIGSTKIVEALSNCLVSKGNEFNDETYKIEFNLGYDSEFELPSKEYYVWQTASSFPTPTRDGYLFLGWELDGEVVTSVSGKSAKLSAKWVSSDAYRLIEDKDIFNQKPNRYLVFFKKDGCTYCERIEKDIIEYSLNILEEDYKNSLNLYVINLKTSTYTSPIIKNTKYDSVHVDGVTNWEDLYVPSTPTLIEVYVENGISTAKLVAVGSSKIVKELDNYLIKGGSPIGEKKSYQISIDYGYDNKKEIFEKFENSSFVLPTLSREGYVFVGYEENGEIVREIENKDYNLKAIWKGIDDVIQIEDKDIFNQMEDEYYILFVEQGSNTYEKVMMLALRYQYGSEKDLPLYVVDVKDSIIKRSFTEQGGEGYNNKFYVSDSTTWDELYIYATPSMIKITKGEIVSASYLNCHLSSVTKFIEALLKNE